jgi:hypothetical protein
MSKCCLKCEIGEKTGNNQNRVLPFVYATTMGPSREWAHGALQSCIHLHKHHNVVYGIILMDDDLSMKNILKCFFMDAFEAPGLIDEILKTTSGGNRVDNVKLQLTHSPILRLTDHNHRNRCYANKCYNLARLPKKKSICTTACR